MALRVGTAAGFTIGAAYLPLFAATGNLSFLLSSAVGVAVGVVGLLGLRSPTGDAEALLFTGAIGAVTVSAMTSPVIRGGTWAAVVVLGMLGALVLPDSKQRRYQIGIGLLLLGQVTWPLFGLATAIEAAANLIVSSICATAGIVFVRMAKRALQTSEQARIEIFRSVPVGLFRVAPGGQLIDANPALAEMLACESHHDLIGYNVAGLYETPEEWTDLAALLKRLDHPQRFAHRMVRRDGEIIWGRGYAQAVRIEGEVVYYEGAVEDVTQRREAEKVSRRHAERFRNVFERAPIAIWEEDFTAVGSRLDEIRADGVTDLRAHLLEEPDEVAFLVSLIRFVDVNPAGIALLGAADKQQALNAVIPDDAPAAVVEGFVEEFIAIWEDVDQMTMEIKGATADGGTTDLALSWAVGRDPSGHLDLSRAVVAIQDIAIVKEAERELAALVESKDELIAAVSHELRTPMTTILGMSFELRDHGEEFTRDELSEFVSLIADQSRELANIVEDLLVAARTEAGTLSIRPEAVDVVTEIGQITSLEPWSPRVETDGPVLAWADPLRLRQILRNLLTNAERYGGDEVSIEVEHRNKVAVIRVRDSGTGVSFDERESIFEPYVRASGDEALPGSLGLGLPVSRRLARLMSGDLVYRFDGTSVFELSLPTTPPAAT